VPIGKYTATEVRNMRSPTLQPMTPLAALFMMLQLIADPGWP